MNNPRAYIEASAYNNTIKVEFPGSDQTIDDLCHAFYTLCIGLTWNSDTVIKGMKEFVEEHEDYGDE